MIFRCKGINISDSKQIFRQINAFPLHIFIHSVHVNLFFMPYSLRNDSRRAVVQTAPGVHAILRSPCVGYTIEVPSHSRPAIRFDSDCQGGQCEICLFMEETAKCF